MSFWNTSDGANLQETAEKEFSSGGGDFEPIPDNTNCLALVNGATWKTNNNGDRYIGVRWDIVKPESLAGRVVFQNLWVKDDNPQAKDPAKKRDKDLRMFASIDANAGGKLARSGREPDDDDLALALTNKQMMIKVMLMEPKDGKPLNWVSAVSPKGGSLAVSEVKVAPKPQQRQSVVDDSDIPF